MKVTKAQLKRIVMFILNENDENIGINARYMQARNVNESVAVLAYSYIELYKPFFDVLDAYRGAKEDAFLPGADKYFHFLGFFAAASLVDKEGWSEEEVIKTLEKLGREKERFDSAFSRSSVARVGYAASMEEWEKDMESNREGINAGLAARKGTDGGLKQAYDKLAYTLNDLIDNSSKPPEEAKKWWVDNYGWAMEKWPKHYGFDKKFIQPRYNCLLSPDDRRFAWKRQKSIPGFVKKLQGPLTI